MKVELTDFANLAQIVEEHLKDVSVVSFDIFDTIIRRRVAPDTIKELSCSFIARMLSSRNIDVSSEEISRLRTQIENELRTVAVQKNKDADYKIEDMCENLLREITGYTEDDILLDLKAESIKYEIYLEQLATEPTPGIKDVLNLVRQHKKRIIYVSDMYYSVEHILAVLKKCNLAGYFDAGYVSSRELALKVTGRLFDIVIKQEDVHPQEIVHIGDNYLADGRAAETKGIKSILVQDPGEFRRRKKLAFLNSNRSRSKYWTGRYNQEILSTLHESADDQEKYYRLGYTIAGPIYTLFIQYVIEKCQEYKLDRLYFIAREGLLFRQIYKKIISALNIIEDMPPTYYLCASRFSTAACILNQFTLENIKSSGFPQHKGLAGLLRSYNLPVEELRGYAASAGLNDLHEALDISEENQRLEKFLSDPNVKQIALRRRSELLPLLEKYLEGIDFFTGGSVGFVDVGWRGTIQENLKLSFGDRHGFPDIRGLYFGCIRKKNSYNKVNVTMEGFYQDNFKGSVLGENVFDIHVHMFEMFAGARHGTTLGYKYCERNNRVRPVFKANDKSYGQVSLNNRMQSLRNGIRDYVKLHVKYLPLLGGSLYDQRPYWCDQIKRIVFYPTKEEINTIMSLELSEDFGSDENFQFGFSEDVGFFDLIRNYKKLDSELSRAQWRDGALRMNFSPGITFLLELHRTLLFWKRLLFKDNHS